MSQRFSLNSVLRRRDDLFAAVLEGSMSNWFLIGLTVFSLVVIAAYGFVIGTFANDSIYWIRDAQNLIMVIVASFVLCLPSLYIFAAFRGSNISLDQLIGVSIIGLASLAMILVGFLPIVWFFTWISEMVAFVRVMDVVTVGIAVLMHIGVIGRGLSAAYKKSGGLEGKAREGMEVFALWAIVYLVVTLQMTINLEPFFPNQIPF